MSRLDVKLKMCKGCAEDGFITEIAQAPGVFYLRCRNADCPTTCWYACGLCKAAYMHYAAETDADRAKFAKHLRSKHKVTSDIGPSGIQHPSKKQRVAGSDTEEEDDLSADYFPELVSVDDDMDLVEGAEVP